MAYRFTNAANVYIEFAIAPLVGYPYGPITVVTFAKRSATANGDHAPAVLDSTLAGFRLSLEFDSASNNHPGFQARSGAINATAVTLNSTSVWYILGVTWAGTGSTPTFHVEDGSGWAHTAGDGALVSANYTFVAGDRLFSGSPFAGSAMGGDIVCVGIKKSNSTNLQIETLGRTSFATWLAFGFDWLIGYDTSLESAGKLQDQASPGTGDEIARSGTVTTGVADPAGWSFATAAAATGGFLPFM